MKNEKADGFTLVEMLAVLVVTAIAMAVLAENPFIRSRPQSAVTLARQISVAVAALSAKAITEASTQSIVVDVVARVVTAGLNRIDLPPNMKLSVKTGAELIVEESKGVIVFFPDGTSSGGEISLGGPSGAVMIVQISWITGAVHLIEQAK